MEGVSDGGGEKSDGPEKSDKGIDVLEEEEEEGEE